jgi:hypothetical protein
MHVSGINLTDQQISAFANMVFYRFYNVMKRRRTCLIRNKLKKTTTSIRKKWSRGVQKLGGLYDHKPKEKPFFIGKLHTHSMG